jgi:hypothetical protein
MLKQKQVGEVGRRVLCPLLGLALGAQSPPLRAQAPADPDVARGIQQIQAGDLDAGIFTLDAVVQRLAREPARSREASLAYLYLGVAYLGKSLESAAKAKFREAVLRDKDLTVSPDQFPPKVIDLFEAAKREATEKKGSKTGLILLGIGAAAAGGAALALGGSAGPSAASSPSPSPATACPLNTKTGTVALAPDERDVFTIPTFAVPCAGTLDAVATWDDPNVRPLISIRSEDGVTLNVNSSSVAIPPPFNRLPFSVAVQPGRYNAGLYRNPGGPSQAVPIRLEITHPGT